MNPDTLLKIQSLSKYAALMTKEQVAAAIGFAVHTIPILVRAGMLQPLGCPSRYCVKYFSRDRLAQLLANPTWLNQLPMTVTGHWQAKNALRKTQPKAAHGN